MGKLFDLQAEYNPEKLSRFHTPGHSGCGAAIPPLAPILPLDVTEVEAFDSLYHASGALADLERRLAGVFGTKATLISAGGCTLAIQAMLALAVPQGGKVLIGRNAHRSALNTIALLDLKPSWLYPANGAVITADEVAQGIAENPDAAAVYLTSPNYYGQLCDIQAIAAVAHAHGIPLLVDNAHGSHLGLLRENLHPIHLGADMTACSIHKTLPVLTGGALLNIANADFVPRAKEKMALFGSTSPSYLTMASIDLLCDRLEGDFAAAYTKLEQQVAALRSYAQQAGFHLLEGACDPVRFTLPTGSNGFTGDTAYQAFRAAGAVAEYFDDRAIVFILTPFHEAKDFDRLQAGIAALRERRGAPCAPLCPPPKNRQSCTVREAVFAKSEAVALQDAIGHVAADSVTPCPPGIPVLIPGEEVTPDMQTYLKNCGISQIRVMVE